MNNVLKIVLVESFHRVAIFKNNSGQCAANSCAARPFVIQPADQPSCQQLISHSMEALTEVEL